MAGKPSDLNKIEREIRKQREYNMRKEQGTK